jgi:hypothetical protein
VVVVEVAVVLEVAGVITVGHGPAHGHGHDHDQDHDQDHDHHPALRPGARHDRGKAYSSELVRSSAPLGAGSGKGSLDLDEVQAGARSPSRAPRHLQEQRDIADEPPTCGQATFDQR